MSKHCRTCGSHFELHQKTTRYCPAFKDAGHGCRTWTGWEETKFREDQETPIPEMRSALEMALGIISQNDPDDVACGIIREALALAEVGAV